ncbi:MAG: glycosyltransferase family 2 protein [Clostridiales bacterium]|nr:glycosyltransferase family 2 protein [Clostridiales bacterium]
MSPTPQPKLSIVVPVYNRATVVERTLDSLAHQTLRPLSIILVDNNSTDNTADVLERWASARRSPLLHITVTTEQTAGAASARNRGLSIVDTPLTMFFDSDDYMEPWLAEKVVETFAQSPDIDIVGWDIIAGQENNRNKIMRFHADDKLMYRSIVHGLLSTQRYAAATHLFRDSGGWDPSVRVWDDMELSVRLLTSSPNVKKLETPPAVTTTYSAQSITADSDHEAVSPDKEHALDLCEQTLRNNSMTRLVRWVDYRRAILAAEYASAGERVQSDRLMSVIKSKPRWLFKLIWLKHRLYRRGTYMLAPFPRGNGRAPL